MSGKDERWLPALGFEGIYAVSDQGRVRREIAGRGTYPGRIMTTYEINGLTTVRLTRSGRTTTNVVHRLVLAAFVGDEPGLFARHRNGDRSDNRLANLFWSVRTTDNHASKHRDEGRVTRRFLQSLVVDRLSGCWLWLGRSLTRNGYARFSDGRRTVAHRWSYARWRGPIPDGLEVDHLCRVRRCVNPAHLEATTPQENRRRSLEPHPGIDELAGRWMPKQAP